MKKILKIVIIVSLAVVIALGGTALTLSLITVKPMSQFEGYSYVRVIERFDPQNMGRLPDDTQKKIINDGLKTVKSSVLRNIFSGKVAIRNTKVTDPDDDDKKIPLAYPASTAKSGEATFTAAARPKSNEIALLYEYDSLKTNSDFRDKDGNKIEYDRLLIIIPSGTDKLQTVKLYPFCLLNLEDQNKEFYSVYEFKAKMYTGDLYNAIVDSGEFSVGNSGGMDI